MPRKSNPYTRWIPGSPEHTAWLGMFKEGLTYTEIARRKKVSRQRVEQIYNAHFRHLFNGRRYGRRVPAPRNLVASGIGGRIRLFRRSQQLTLRELGEILGVSQSSLSDFENGRCVPLYSTIYSFAVNAKVKIRWLLLGEGEMLCDHSCGVGAPSAPSSEAHKQRALELLTKHGAKEHRFELCE